MPMTLFPGFRRKKKTYDQRYDTARTDSVVACGDMDDEKVKTFLKLPLTVELRPSSPDAQVLPKTFEIRYSPFDRDQNSDLA